ncbi:MAG: class I SAM-dependent methyltransferase [Dehalococcoidales bacterium]|nr:class I SAM-dependent methyltransferase [Dehalococcoidales bacterium]
MTTGNYVKHAAIWGMETIDRSEEIVFYAALAGNYGNKVLSPMCATGEIAFGLAERGFNVTAFDIEPEMITVAQNRYKGRENLSFLTGDVTHFSLPESDYHFCFIGTGDFHHLLSNEDMLKALKCIHNHLAETGCLILKLSYPGSESWHSPQQRFELSIPPETGIRAWKLAETAYDAVTMRTHIRQEIFIEEKGNTETFLHEFDLQLVTREALERLLHESGYKLIGEYSGYDFSEWNPASPDWIVVTQKE